MPGTAMQLINVPMHSLKLTLRFSDSRISPSHSAPCTVEWLVVKSYSHSMWQSHCSGRSPSALQNGASQEDMTYSSGRVGGRERGRDRLTSHWLLKRRRAQDYLSSAVSDFSPVFCSKGAPGISHKTLHRVITQLRALQFAQ